LPSFLRRPVRLEEAQRTLRWRHEQRVSRFLDSLRRLVFEQPASPYRVLLGWAGCEYGDVERLTREEGLEGALTVLLRRGVYLTTDELRGRRSIRRGSAVLETAPGAFRNPLAGSHVAIGSSGSGGAASQFALDFASIRDDGVAKAAIFAATGLGRCRQAHWGVPGGWALTYLLQCAVVGAPPERWFSQIDPASPRLHSRYRWSARALWLGSRLANVPLPYPIHAPLEAPGVILDWLRFVLGRGETPHLFTYPSSAVKLSQYAGRVGADLRGVILTLGSEPVTTARLAAVRASGARILTSYGAVDCGLVGNGCQTSADPDDYHLSSERLVLVQPGAASAETTGLPEKALLLTSLLSTAPLVLLNASLGDQATVSSARCGCPLERLGWTTHVQTVRSFEKLTAAGMAFLDTDVVRLLEETLPARFGGSPTDYQLVEEEAADGQPRLRLRVHPAVGPLDSAALLEALLNGLGAGSPAGQVMALQLREAVLLVVERAVPHATSTGKIQHLHQERRPLSLAGRAAS
jgi:hypothetical protein